MQATGNIVDISIDFKTSKPKLTLLINEKQLALNGYDELKDKEKLSIEIKQWRNKRSKDANAYMWLLCQKIAEKVPNVTKEIVYRKAINKVGQFEILPIKEIAVDTFINAWTSKGVGWVCESLGNSRLNGYINVIAYYGSSTYDTKSMSKLLEEVIYEAKELNIPTLEDIELERLIESWGDKNDY